MKIAFATSYLRTMVLSPIARRLTAEGHDVIWLSPGNTWNRWLAEQGWDPERLFDMDPEGPYWTAPGEPSADDLAYLQDLERASGMGVKDVIGMDRLLREKPESYALKYMAACGRRLEKILENHGTRVVFSEQTFVFELLITMICKKRGLKSIAPAVVRIPDNRTGFFEGHLQEKLVPLENPASAHLDDADRFLEEYEARKPRPNYFHWNNQAPAPRKDWVGKLVKHFKLGASDPFDETRFPRSRLIKDRVNEVFNYRLTRWSAPFEASPEARTPYIYVTLHKQPEASIDVLGAAFADQLALVGALARKAPASHEIWVKEHSNALGQRSLHFYREALKFPRVRLISPFADGMSILQKADLTFAVSGTVCYEASLLGRRAATAASMYFGDVLTANAFDPNRNSVAELLSRPVPDRSKRVEFLAKVLASSSPGTIAFPSIAPWIMSDSNIETLTEGFARLLSRQDSRS